MRGILFVCLGNICRSPLAEAAFRAELNRTRQQWSVDSAGTGGWHSGDPPDPRAQAVARQSGIDISGYRARQVAPQDFAQFDLIVAMDRQNMSDLRGIMPADAKARLALFLDFTPGSAGQSVADPYYGDARDFEAAWRQICVGAAHLVRTVSDRDWWSLAGSNR